MKRMLADSHFVGAGKRQATATANSERWFEALAANYNGSSLRSSSRKLALD
jgi:hypothetical protein